MIRHCNARFCEMFGFGKLELQGHSLSKLYPSSEEFQRIGQIGVDKMRGLGRYADERIMRRKDGSLFWCRVRGQSLEPDQPFARSVWSFADISEMRPVTELTPRERQVAKMLAEGLTSKEIARGLDISPRTVEVHRARLMQKFGARNGLELVAHLVGLPLLGPGMS
ncbi:LuxR C-terminal-related transcriptional regulator [Marivivens sp. JLT3646]|uniref:LuxR C-terminal-related transcriptional regulator n=1 Tax=Marivivens sp. JLT3646 TaxID=1920883 RepID=UPI000A453A8C